MKIITDKSIRENVSKYGFAGYDKCISEIINSSFVNYAQNILHKSEKYAKSDKIDMDAVVKGLRLKSQPRQRGGAETTMPLEYYGVDSGHYHDEIVGGFDASVTNDAIRAPMDVNDPSGVIENFDLIGGGQPNFCVPKTTASKISLIYDTIKVQPQVREFIVKKFETDFSTVFQKAKKLSGRERYLREDILNKVLSQRAFSKLFKE